MDQEDWSKEDSYLESHYCDDDDTESVIGGDDELLGLKYLDDNDNNDEGDENLSTLNKEEDISLSSVWNQYYPKGSAEIFYAQINEELLWKSSSSSSLSLTRLSTTFKCESNSNKEQRRRRSRSKRTKPLERRGHNDSGSRPRLVRVQAKRNLLPTNTGNAVDEVSLAAAKGRSCRRGQRRASKDDPGLLATTTTTTSTDCFAELDFLATTKGTHNKNNKNHRRRRHEEMIENHFQRKRSSFLRIDISKLPALPFGSDMV